MGGENWCHAGIDNSLYFADVNGDAYADAICYWWSAKHIFLDYGDGSQSIGMVSNYDAAVAVDCGFGSIRFADVNEDGRDDFICLHDNDHPEVLLATATGTF